MNADELKKIYGLKMSAKQIARYYAKGKKITKGKKDGNKKFNSIDEAEKEYASLSFYAEALSAENKCIGQILDGLHIASEDSEGHIIPLVTRLTMAITAGKINPESINAEITVK